MATLEDIGRQLVASVLTSPGRTLDQENNERGYNRGQQGVFGLHPLATPKYALNRPRDNEFKDTLARMYISLGDTATQKAYLASLPQDAETQALATVLTSNANSAGAGFIDFFLQQVQEGFQEVMQVDKVMGDNFVAFYFGQEPPVFQYSGSLLNSMQDDQRVGFYRAYNLLLRGTQMARRGTLLRLRYDSVIVSGTLNSTSQALNAENEMIVPFSFSMLVKEYLVFQKTPFTKITPRQYVQLASGFATDPLSGVGVTIDTRARAVMVEQDDLEDAPVGTVPVTGIGVAATTPQAALEKKAEDGANASNEDNKTQFSEQEQIDNAKKVAAAKQAEIDAAAIRTEIAVDIATGL